MALWGQIRETNAISLNAQGKSLQAMAGLLPPCRSGVGGEEGNGELGEGKPTGGAEKRYEKEIVGENHMLAPPRKAFICFW